jgi:hypothetical protein
MGREACRAMLAIGWAGRAAQVAFPWAPEAYPGLLRGMAELLGGRAAVRTILDWRRGRRRPPEWAIDVL